MKRTLTDRVNHNPSNGRLQEVTTSPFTFLSKMYPSQTYAPQTKILEGGTKDEIRIFEALFNGSWPKLSTHALEKCFENPDFIFCSSFQNLRLGGVKRRFWKTEHISEQVYPSQTKILEGRMNLSECVFEALFKGVSTRFGLQTVEKCFENAFGNVLPTSKIFVWGP
jgi:hypothetical protein